MALKLDVFSILLLLAAWLSVVYVTFQITVRILRARQKAREETGVPEDAAVEDVTARMLAALDERKRLRMNADMPASKELAH